MAYTIKVPAGHLALAPNLIERVKAMKYDLSHVALGMGATYLDLKYLNGFLIIDTDNLDFTQKFKLLNEMLFGIHIIVTEK